MVPYLDTNDGLATLNAFVNSDAMLNRKALWSSQGKQHLLKATMVREIRHCDKRFLCYNEDVSIFFKHFVPILYTYGVMNFFVLTVIPSICLLRTYVKTHKL